MTRTVEDRLDALERTVHALIEWSITLKTVSGPDALRLIEEIEQVGKKEILSINNGEVP